MRYYTLWLCDIKYLNVTSQVDKQIGVGLQW